MSEASYSHVLQAPCALYWINKKCLFQLSVVLLGHMYLPENFSFVAHMERASETRMPSMPLLGGNSVLQIFVALFSNRASV